MSSDPLLLQEPRAKVTGWLPVPSQRRGSPRLSEAWGSACTPQALQPGRGHPRLSWVPLGNNTSAPGIGQKPAQQLQAYRAPCQEGRWAGTAYPWGG